MAKKLLCLILALLMILPMITGCSFFKKEEESSDTPTEEVFELTRELLSSYVIIIPNECSEEMGTVATLLRDQIKKVTGVEPEIKSDFLKEGSSIYCESEYEILLGLVDRAESKEFHRSLKSNDSGYALINKKIVLGGHNEGAAESSVYLLQSDILKGKADADVIMTSIDQKTVSGAYSYNDITLNGVSISEYTIVYARSGAKNENIIAAELAKRIADISGFVLDIVYDKSSEPAQYEIHIGDTNRITDAMISERKSQGYSDSHSYISKCENGVWISGNSYIMLTLAIDRFMNMAKGNGDTGTIDVSGNECHKHIAAEVSVMNYNVRYDLETTERDPQGVMTTIAAEDPDVFGAIEVTDKWEAMLKSYFESDYTYVSGKKNQNSASSGEYLPIFFKTAKYELVEQGSKWLSKTPDRPSMYSGAAHYMMYTYVVLKDKATGTRFMYINAHFEPYQKDSARKVRALQAEQLKAFIEKQSLPVICGGDFNAIPKEEPISILTTGGNLRYALNLAKEKTQTAGTMVSEDYTTLGTRVYDYIFVLQSRVSVQEYKMIDNQDANGKYPSDHIPVSAKVTVYQ